MCFLVFLMITGLLIWRTSVKGQRLIARDTYNEMGILRPRPLECFLLLNMLHICGKFRLFRLFSYDLRGFSVFKPFFLFPSFDQPGYYIQSAY